MDVSKRNASTKFSSPHGKHPRGVSPEMRGKRRFDSRRYDDGRYPDGSSLRPSRYQHRRHGGSYPHRSNSPEEIGEIRSERPSSSSTKSQNSSSGQPQWRSIHRNGARSDDARRDSSTQNHHHHHHHHRRSPSALNSPPYHFLSSPQRGRSSRPVIDRHESTRHEREGGHASVLSATTTRRLGDSRPKGVRPEVANVEGGAVRSNSPESSVDVEMKGPSSRKSSLLLTPDERPEGEVESPVRTGDRAPLLSPESSRSRSNSQDGEIVEEEEESPVIGDVPAVMEEAPSQVKTFESVRCPLLEGCGRVGSYRRLNKISEGTYGAVYRAQCVKTGKVVALKHIKYHEKVWEEGFPLTSLREISILLELKHPNIVNVLEVVVGDNPNHVFMVMEYIDHELKLLLEKNVPPFSTSERKTLIIGLLRAVEHMHSRWVVHRDLKTSNLLYSNKGELKVCDFGMARKFGEPLKPYTQNVVTMWYRAPELLLGQQPYSQAVDMWSVGCIIGEIFLRRPLFDGRTETETLDKIFRICGTPTEESWPGVSSLPVVANNKIEFSKHRSNWRQTFPAPRTPFSDPSAVSDTGLELLKSLLCLNPEKRLSAKEALKHQFFEEKPHPQRSQLMPTAPESNILDRRVRHPEESLNEQDILNRDLFHGQEARYTFGARVDAARYLIEMETAAQKLQQQQQKKRGGSGVQ